MQLTRYTDYSLRVLIYLASGQQGASVGQIAEFYGISHHHLAKVVAQLASLGVVESIRGRGGGLNLALDPASIRIGDVIRATEKIELVECYNDESNECPITSSCSLKHLLFRASDAFLAVLDGTTLADLVPGTNRLVQLGRSKSEA